MEEKEGMRKGLKCKSNGTFLLIYFYCVHTIPPATIIVHDTE